VKIDEQRIYQPGQISAMVLEKLKRDAEEYLGEKITQAIITVPANFDDLQRQATKEAGRLAGLDVLRLVNEPTAAAMAYGLGKGNDGVIAVYDFGGGTFDVTLMEISGRTFEVIVCEGDSYLGGDDLDDLIVQMVVDDVFQEYNHDLTSDPGALVRLKEAAEKAKCELSFARTASISLPFLAMINGDPLNYERSISRADFEEIAEPIVQRTIDCCERALKAARMDPGQIDKVILVGGSTRMPMVQEMVEDFFGMPPHRGVNPDEVVALGAATQAGVLAGALEEVVLLDVTPRSLGLETRDDNFSRIIEKNSTIPIKMAKTFTTTEENQEMVNIHVLQGEEAQASANLSLGKFLLKGIQPSPAGVPRIRVTFQINADGILEISAQDMATGSENQLTITHTFLSEEERKAKAAKRKQEASGAGRGAGRRRRSGGAKRGRPVDTGVKPRRIGGVRSPSDTSSGEYASSTSAASETPIPARTPIPGRGTQGGVRTPAPAPQAPPMAPAPGPSRLAPAAQRTPAPAPQPAPAPAPMPSASPSPAAGGASSGFAMLADTAVRERPLAPGVGKMPVGSSPIPAPTMPPRRPAAPPAMELTPQQREDDTGDLPGGQEEVMAAPAPPLAPAPAARSRTASASSTGDDSGSDTGGRHHRVKPEDLMESGVDLAEPLDAPAPSRSQPVASTPLPTDEEDEEEAEQTMRPAPGSMATPSPISRRPSAPAAPSAPPPSSPSSPALPRAPIPKAPSREVAAAPAGESLWSPSELVEELRRDSGEALKAVSATEAEKTKEAAAQRCPQSRITEPMELAFTLLEADRGDENAISCYADALAPDRETAAGVPARFDAPAARFDDLALQERPREVAGVLQALSQEPPAPTFRNPPGFSRRWWIATRASWKPAASAPRSTSSRTSTKGRSKTSNLLSTAKAPTKRRSSAWRLSTRSS
jgi:actin-like ATPase involved in cell morphogenesis